MNDKFIFVLILSGFVIQISTKKHIKLKNLNINIIIQMRIFARKIHLTRLKPVSDSNPLVDT